MRVLARQPNVGYLDNNLWVPKPAVNIDGLKNALTFPIFERGAIQNLTLWKESEHHVLVPREFWSPSDFTFPVIDCRPRCFTSTGIQSKIQLDHTTEGGKLVPTGKDVQHKAMDALLSSRGGVLQLACGLGKTVVALDYVARKGFPAIIVVDTTQLLNQWKEEIEEHLIVPGGIGYAKGGTFFWKKSIVLATYSSLALHSRDIPEEARRWFGAVIFDEAHHVAAATFSRAADMFYGTRIGLTATPDRDDGRHVVYNFHLGNVLYKNLEQELKPDIYFLWTGTELDKDNPLVTAATQDVNNELHIGKVAGFLGTHRPRIDLTLDLVREAVAEGRKVLVLSRSVDALVNMFAVWSNIPDLISDIPFPAPAEVGETVEPLELGEKDVDRLQGRLREINMRLAQGKTRYINEEQQKKDAILLTLQQHAVYKKCETLWNKRRSDYLKRVLQTKTDAGLMIYKVNVHQRTEMLRTRAVTFAVMKYGKEGLNERSLDTVIVNEPVGNEGGLQQLLGRILRKKQGKRKPIAIFLEDNIGPFIGMCQKLRRFLREWPAADGGPFAYQNLGRPNNAGVRTWTKESLKVFGL